MGSADVGLPANVESVATTQLTQFCLPPVGLILRIEPAVLLKSFSSSLPSSLILNSSDAFATAEILALGVLPSSPIIQSIF